MDAMVDSHYQFGLKKVALALEADHLKGMTNFLAGLGCEIQAALSATSVRGLDGLPVENIFVGDLEDLEKRAKGADLLVANSNGRQAAASSGSSPISGPACRSSTGSAPTRRCGSATGEP